MHMTRPMVASLPCMACEQRDRHGADMVLRVNDIRVNGERWAVGLSLLPMLAMDYVLRQQGNGMERYAPELSSVPVWLTLQS